MKTIIELDESLIVPGASIGTDKRRWKIPAEFSNDRLPKLIERYKLNDNPTRVSEEYWVLLTNWMHKLTRKYFKNSQEERHNERLDDMVILFIEYSLLPEFASKSGVWLMSRWSFILPDVLYYQWLKSKGVAIDEPLTRRYKPNALVSQLRKVEVLKSAIQRRGEVLTRKSIMVEWLNSQPNSPKVNKMFHFYYTLEKYSSVILSKNEYEYLLTKQEMMNDGSEQ